jgi:hypothetical protein
MQARVNALKESHSAVAGALREWVAVMLATYARLALQWR